MASPVDTTVKFYRDDLPGAPVLSGVAGAAIDLFDACLVTGFGLRTATNVVVAGGVATVTLPSDAKNPNLVYSVILLEGVTGAMTDLNGEQRVTAADATTLQFATAVSDGTATGTITVKTAPAGWEKRFSGTNKAVYRSLSPESFGMHLWVDDSAAKTCLVRGFESMTDVDTGTGPFPTVAQSATGGFWVKSTVANSTANAWDVFADHRALYFCPLAATGAVAANVGQASYFFGDIVPYWSGDAFAAVLSAASSDPGNASSNGSVHSYSTSGSVRHFSRAISGTGSAVPAFHAAETGSVTAASGADSQYGVFPPADGAMRLARIISSEGAATGTSAVLRGVFPGVYHIPQNNIHATFQRSHVLAPVSGLGGRRLTFINAVGNFGSSVATAGRMPVDISGPWR